jgi:hypothetical protein
MGNSFFVRYIRVVGSYNCDVDLIDRHVILGFVDIWDATVGAVYCLHDVLEKKV